jgi:hypothetical protein
LGFDFLIIEYGSRVLGFVLHVNQGFGFRVVSGSGYDFQFSGLGFRGFGYVSGIRVRVEPGATGA